MKTFSYASIWRRKPAAGLLILLLMGVLGLCRDVAHASGIAYGSINNFDTVNDTGRECHGFEIELEDCESIDITYTYDYNHYGTPQITEDKSVAGHPKCRIRWQAKLKTDGSWSAYTAIPAGPIAPTDGHQFTNPAVNFGGEHFGVGYRKPPTAVYYRWLVDNGNGELVPGGNVQVSTPVFNYLPPAAGVAPRVQAVIAPPPPPAPEPKEFGQPLWVKEIRTTTHNNREIKLRELVSDDPDDANDINWRNGEPDEVEVEWQLLQKDYKKIDAANNELKAAPEGLPNGDEVVTRRYEFFKYIGPVDEETGEAKVQKVGADDVHGSGIKRINGIDVDLSTVEVVGEYTGAQMAAVDVDAAVGLIDHVAEADLNAEYAPRAVTVPGALPFTCTFEGLLPAGMTFDETTGILSGTPAEGGQFGFTVTAWDEVNPQVSKNYLLTVNAGALPPLNLLDTAAVPLDGGTTVGDGAYDSGTVVNVAAVAAPGYTFLNWTDNGVIVSTQPNFTMTMDVSHSLVAHFVLQEGAPTIVTLSAPQILPFNAPLVLEVAAAGAGELRYQWFKNGQKIDQATGARYQRAAAQWQDAGAYEVEVAGAAVTRSAVIPLAVVDAAARTVTAAAGSSVTLATRVEGANLTSVWHKDGSALPPSVRISGADGNSLRVQKLSAADAGLYTLIVSGPGGDFETQGIQLAVFTDSPLILESPLAFPVASVGSPFEYRLPLDPEPARAATFYLASGLPPGLKIDPKSGWITGRPTAVAPQSSGFSVKLTAANGKGRVTASGQLLVLPMPLGCAGEFSAAVGRHEAFNAGLGGSMQMSIVPSGSLTGRLQLGSATYPFRGALRMDTPDGRPGAEVVIPRKAASPLLLAVSINGPVNAFEARLSDTGDVHAFGGWRKIWDAKANPALDYAGYHTFALDIPAVYVGDARVPQGSGYGTCVVTPAGAVTLAGKTADGETLTSSTFAGPGGEAVVYRSLYAATARGSIAGVLDIDADRVGGGLTWSRPASAAAGLRLYKDGFPAVLDLIAAGGRYQPPESPAVFLGVAPAPMNALLSVREGGLGVLQMPVTIAPASRATVSTNTAANPRRATLTVTPKTGLFRGSLALEDPNPMPIPAAPRVIRRNVTFEGIAVPVEGSLRGCGFFLAPLLPAPGAPVATSALLSGQVQLSSTAP